ncbi:hypothetical protein [Streptomyces sp. NBC_01190]|uniref:hypothetical protein n=1 Tax=Streptomyces sp. NBC_01190 TaxID=2903767 RepID=UPI00386CA550|nr:hypothetical protein OG519_15875 [Streptomyces sp. NBC_01190]
MWEFIIAVIFVVLIAAGAVLIRRLDRLRDNRVESFHYEQSAPTRHSAERNTGGRRPAERSPGEPPPSTPDDGGPTPEDRS